jgi:arabinofuranosyltransferase
LESVVSTIVTPRAARSERKTRLVFIGVSVLLGVALSGLLNITLVPGPLKNDMVALPATVDVGFLDPLEPGYGFYDSETAPGGATYRWTGAHATLTFPYAANLGRYGHVSMRLAANRAPGQAPADVKISLNGRPEAHFTVASEFRTYTVSFDARKIPNPYLDPSHVQIDIESSTVRYQGDPRQLGVAVDWIQVQPERDQGEMVLDGAVWAAVLAAVLLVATMRLSLIWSLVYGLGALVSLALIHATAMPRAIPVSVEVALAGLAWLIAVWLAPRVRPAWGLGLAASGLWLVVAGRLLGDWQMDDAYISYRYAWNLVHGSGLVYNPGEVVEGYTNFLWTLLAAAAIWASVQPVGVMLAANIALAMGVVGVTYYLSSRLSGRAYPWPLVAVLLLSVDVALITYGARGSGMEAAAFGFFVILSVVLLWGGQGESKVVRGLGGICLALASLTRPEGLLVAVILLSVRAWQDRRSGAKTEGTREAGRLALAGLVPLLVVVGPYEVWRIGFYGYPFPNTFYAKTGATAALVQRGLMDLGLFWSDHWLVASLALLGLGASLLRSQRRGAHLGLAALVAGYALYIVWVGGDFFPGWRFYVPILAPIALLAQEGVRIGLSYLPSARLLRLGAVGALVVVGALYLRDALWFEEANKDFQQTKLNTAYISRWGSAGLWLRDNTPPQTWTVAKGAGAIAYFSQRRTIDIFGLNDLHIGHLAVASLGEGRAGHEKQDPQYVLGRRPDFILAEWDPNFRPVETQLKRDYAYLIVRAPTGPNVDWWRLK